MQKKGTTEKQNHHPSTITVVPSHLRDLGLLGVTESKAELELSIAQPWPEKLLFAVDGDDHRLPAESLAEDKGRQSAQPLFLKVQRSMWRGDRQIIGARGGG